MHSIPVSTAGTAIKIKIQMSAGKIMESVRVEAFTAVTMKKAVFEDVAPCRYCVNRRFGGMYHLHHQGRRKKKKMSTLVC
jgi:hypothetical protein